MIIDWLRLNGRKYLHHYLWPSRLHSRLFNFDYYYEGKNNDLRINLGAGPYFKKNGWISTDFLSDFKKIKKNDGIVYLDLKKNLDKLPFRDVKAFYLSHVLEHFRVSDAIRLLKSTYHSMDMGGVLRIVVPDAELIINKTKKQDLEYFKPLIPYFKEEDRLSLKPVDMMIHLLCSPACRFNHGNAEMPPQLVTDEFSDILHKSNHEIINLLNNNQFENNQSGSYHLSCYDAELLTNLLKQAGFSLVYKSAFMQSNYGPMREVPLFDGTHPWFSLYVECVK